MARADQSQRVARPRRRAPRPDERRIDPERSRRALLDAALEEFAANGFAGTTVRAIADRASVSKDLISYHFGGKAELYREVQRRWLERDATFRDPSLPLADLAARYLNDALSDPRPIRLLAWRGLSGQAEQPPDLATESEDLTSMVSRQQNGEIARDIDPAALRLILIGAIAAPALMPHVVHRLFGVDASSDEFKHRYEAGLRAVIAHLTPTD
ncbi:MAG: TetR/AcrR family transcriptional regulator [Actinomycetota bacterium]|nr:TetR/AcrR family transcriptional regulator [Actinomycetota bacterium]